MRKSTQYLIRFVMVLGVLGCSLSCLAPLNFNPDDLKVEVDLSGNINVTDVTAAVLLLTNQSRTVDVTRVIISQRINGNSQQINEEDESPVTIIAFENEPRRLTKRAKYLSPGEISYIVDIEYAVEGGGSGSERLVIPLPLPREIVEVFIYRSVSGEVKITTNRGLDFDVSDTGYPVDDTMVGQGSSPAVIPPENRNRMATFVVVNQTKSRNIDSVRFEMDQLAYTMGAVKVRDRQSIALGQGTWKTTLSYNGTPLPVAHSIIVPSNDPQALREHKLYFYQNSAGQYHITETWPPKDGIAEDILPLNRGFGRGVIQIVNHSASPVTGVTVTNFNRSPEKSLDINYMSFDPPVPVLRNRTGYIDLVGTSGFPIESHNKYRIDITIETGGGDVTVTWPANMVKDIIAEITIEPEDVPSSGNPPNNGSASPYGQGTIRILNQSNSLVNKVTITNSDGESRAITSASFNPPGPVLNNQNTLVYVTGTAAFPIEDGAEYAISVAGTNGGGNFTVEREVMLYGAHVVITIRPEESTAPPGNDGGGTIIIINEDNAAVTKVTVNGPGGASQVISFTQFDPPNPVWQNTAAQVNVNGFPITPGAYYTIVVTAEAGGRTFTEERVEKLDSDVVITLKPESVYIAGWYEPMEYADIRACYWVDGKRVALPSPANSNAQATAITLSGSRVYTVGWSDAEGGQALFWIDKIPQEFLDDDCDTKATGIAVTESGVIYITGQYDWRPCYWEIDNGNVYRHDFNFAFNGCANGVAVSKGKVYIAGSYYDGGTGTKAFYAEFNEKENPTFADCISIAFPNPDVIADSYALAIAVSDAGVVYVSGNYQNNIDYRFHSWIYSGGMARELGIGDDDYGVAGMVVAGDQVYAVDAYADFLQGDRTNYGDVDGMGGLNPGYWEKSGAGWIFKPLPVPPADIYSNTLGIAVSKGGDVYTVGHHGGNYNSYVVRAGYWVNRDSFMYLTSPDLEIRSKALAVTVGPSIGD